MSSHLAHFLVQFVWPMWDKHCSKILKQFNLNLNVSLDRVFKLIYAEHHTYINDVLKLSIRFFRLKLFEF